MTPGGARAACSKAGGRGRRGVAWGDVTCPRPQVVFNGQALNETLSASFPSNTCIGNFATERCLISPAEPTPLPAVSELWVKGFLRRLLSSRQCPRRELTRHRPLLGEGISRTPSSPAQGSPREPDDTAPEPLLPAAQRVALAPAELRRGGTTDDAQAVAPCHVTDSAVTGDEAKTKSSASRLSVSDTPLILEAEQWPVQPG